MGNFSDQPKPKEENNLLTARNSVLWKGNCLLEEENKIWEEKEEKKKKN